MPSRAEDRYFGNKPGASSKAHRSMVDQYGPEKAERVYHAVREKNKRKRARKRRKGSSRVRQELER